MGIRSFLAFELPRQIRETIGPICGDLKSLPLTMRWVRIENIHLTVVFMGDMPETALCAMADGVEGVCRGFGPFRVRLRGIGVFGSPRNPRVLWAGVDGDMDRLSAFRDAVGEVLRPFGVRRENRRFSPHLTLGRFRKKRGGPGPLLREALRRYRDVESPMCAVNELVLFRSDLKPGGAVYTPVNTWPLSGGESTTIASRR